MKSYKFCAIDESGDIGNGKQTSKYFILVAFLYQDLNFNKKVRKLISKINHNKNNKKITTLHARNDSDKVRLKVLKFLNTTDWECLFEIIDKSKVSNFDYLNTITKFIKKLESVEKISTSLPITKISIVKKVRDLDKRIFITTPMNENTVQMADIIAWVLFKKFEHKDDTYFKLLEKKLTKQNP
jgi:hypothetical protein